MGAGFEASGQQGEAYILTGEKTVQLERAENAILLRTQMSHGALGTGSASQVRLFGFVSGIIVGDLLDLFELLDEAGLSNLHSRLVHSTVKQGYQRQCENALTDEEIIFGYRGQHHVERAFRDMKDPYFISFSPRSGVSATSIAFWKYLRASSP
jgi:hypothetical protein